MINELDGLNFIAKRYRFVWNIIIKDDNELIGTVNYNKDNGVCDFEPIDSQSISLEFLAEIVQLMTIITRLDK